MNKKANTDRGRQEEALNNLPTIARQKLETREEAVTFLTAMHELLGAGFHPDTDFETYLNVDTGEDLFTEAEATALNDRMSEAFDLVDDPYLIAMELFRRDLNQITPSDPAADGEAAVKAEADSLPPLPRNCGLTDTIVDEISEACEGGNWDKVGDALIEADLQARQEEEDALQDRLEGELQTFDQKILIAIVEGRIDCDLAARKELASRGYDRDDKWIGFDKARKTWLTR